MADIFVHHMDDALAAGADLLLVLIHRADPIQRLLRRRDVVSVTGEHDDRRLDLAQINRPAPGQDRGALLQRLPTKRFSTIQRISASFMK